MTMSGPNKPNQGGIMGTDDDERRAWVAEQPKVERPLCDGCDGYECGPDCKYPMTDPFQHQLS